MSEYSYSTSSRSRGSSRGSEADAADEAENLLVAGRLGEPAVLIGQVDTGFERATGIARGCSIFGDAVPEQANARQAEAGDDKQQG